MEKISLVLQRRTVKGKKTQQLRRAGVTPVHLYGRGIESQALQARTQELIQAMARAGATTPVTITVEGDSGEQIAFVREIQWDPVKGSLLHVDLQHVELTERVEAEVPIELVGHAPAARGDATLVQHLQSVTVEALPLEIPHSIQVDVTVLTDLEKEIRVRDLKLPEGVKVLADPDDLIARVEVVRVAEEAAPVTEAQEEAAEAKEEQGEKEQ